MRDFDEIFDPQGMSAEWSSQFSKTFCLPQIGGHFEFFTKIAKHKSAFILKTVLDRAILTKYLTHRASLQSSHPNF